MYLVADIDIREKDFNSRLYHRKSIRKNHFPYIAFKYVENVSFIRVWQSVAGINDFCNGQQRLIHLFLILISLLSGMIPFIFMSLNISGLLLSLEAKKDIRFLFL
jgi:hypothetical protein